MRESKVYSMGPCAQRPSPWCRQDKAPYGGEGTWPLEPGHRRCKAAPAVLFSLSLSLNLNAHLQIGDNKMTELTGV